MNYKVDILLVTGAQGGMCVVVCEVSHARLRFSLTWPMEQNENQFLNTILARAKTLAIQSNILPFVGVHNA